MRQELCPVRCVICILPFAAEVAESLDDQESPEEKVCQKAGRGQQNGNENSRGLHQKGLDRK